MHAEPMSADRMIEVLHDLSIELQDHPEGTDIVQHSVEALEDRMGYEFLAVLIPTVEGEGLLPLALSKQERDAAFLKKDKDYVKWQCGSMTTGVTSWVARTGETARIGNVADDERYFGIRDDVKSELCVPLKVGKRVIGVLNTETTRANAYTALDERFLETAASHFALAITHSHGRYRSAKACSYCNRMRDRQGNWDLPAKYLMRQAGIVATNGICPTCYENAPKKRVT